MAASVASGCLRIDSDQSLIRAGVALDVIDWQVVELFSPVNIG